MAISKWPVSIIVSLRALASKGEVDLEQAIKALSELKAKTGKRKSLSSLEEQLA